MSVVLVQSRYYYVPVRHDAAGELEHELRGRVGGGVLALAYTSQPTLVECCGDFQPWALIPGETLQHQLEAAGVDTLAFDVTLEDQDRWTADGPPGAGVSAA